MSLVADTHVHIYPCHDLAAALRHGARNLSRLAAEQDEDGGTERILCLTECRGQNVFEGLAAGRERPAGLSVLPTGEATAVRVESGDGALFVIAGRQVATRERLEVLALGTRADLADGRSLAETLAAVRASGALAVVPWSPGKWLLDRGRILDRATDASQPWRPLLADSSLRPRGMPEPARIARARAAGLAVLAGSDPLPFPGEERFVGCYAALCRGTFDPARPASSALALLARSGEPLGIRRSLLGVARSLARLAFAAPRRPA